MCVGGTWMLLILLWLTIQLLPDDPYFRFNDVNYQWIALGNWTYETTFNLTGFLGYDNVCALCVIAVL